MRTHQNGSMYDATDDELEADDWFVDMEDYAPKTANDEYIATLGRQVFSLLNEAFPGQVQSGDVTIQQGGFITDELFTDEPAEDEFAAKVFPVLRQEILRQAAGFEGAHGSWSIRFDVDGSTHRQRGAGTDPFGSVSVVVVQGPIDADS